MNPKPETESEQIKRLLEFWYGGNSPGGPGKPNAGATGLSVSSPAPARESESPITSPLATALSNVLRSGTSNSRPTNQTSPAPNKSVRST